MPKRSSSQLGNGTALSTRHSADPSHTPIQPVSSPQQRHKDTVKPGMQAHSPTDTTAHHSDRSTDPDTSQPASSQLSPHLHTEKPFWTLLLIFDQLPLHPSTENLHCSPSALVRDQLKAFRQGHTKSLWISAQTKRSQTQVSPEDLRGSAIKLKLQPMRTTAMLHTPELPRPFPLPL